MTLILRENSEEIRQKIKDAGIDVCLCASFKNAVWLTYGYTDSVHGVGYYGSENGTRSVMEEICSFILDCKQPHFCKDVDEFIADIYDMRDYKDV